MRDTTRQRVFLTFAAGDLAVARPVTARLVVGGGIVLDQAYTTEPFAGARGEIIRASLLTRLRHCTSTLCLFGARTLDDEWVRWVLEAAAEFRLPLIGAALPDEDTLESERCLARLGVEVVSLDRDDILTATRAGAVRQVGPALDAASIAETLYLMRHPLR